MTISIVIRDAIFVARLLDEHFLYKKHSLLFIKFILSNYYVSELRGIH